MCEKRQKAGKEMAFKTGRKISFDWFFSTPFHCHRNTGSSECDRHRPDGRESKQAGWTPNGEKGRTTVTRHSGRLQVGNPEAAGEKNVLKTEWRKKKKLFTLFSLSTVC